MNTPDAETRQADETAIRQLIENWAIWRDTGEWDRFAELWNHDGEMATTFFRGPAKRFVEAARGAASAVLVQHVLGGTAVRLHAGRAVADTRMTINMRVPVEGVLCDVVCTGLFHDLLKKRGDRWLLALRQPIYEKDRIDPVEPGAVVTLDHELLEQFPVGYRYTGYAQERLGLKVFRMLPGTGGEPLGVLRARADAWLAGGEA